MNATFRSRALPLLALSGLSLCARAEETHWSFRAPTRPSIPRTNLKAFSSWARNPIDAFVLSTLEKKGLTPSPPADKRTLLRRVTMDLTGLPPTPQDIAQFLSDPSPDAYEKVVRRLLASPQYGERWAQHWLDVVRFAETNGFELDEERPQSWRYRDYVVRSLNEDKPYDRFLLEQLAGDELAPDDFDMHVATGFLRAGPQHVVGGNQDEAINRQEWLTEATAGVGNAILGLTVNCARCHDHKFDPIPQADYYRLQAFFAATNNHEFKRPDQREKEAYAAAEKALHDRMKPIRDQIAAIEKPYRDRIRQQKTDRLEPAYREALSVEASKRTPEQQRIASEAQHMLNISWDEVVAVLNPADRDRRASLRRQIHELESHAPIPPPTALGIADTLTPTPAVHVLRGGDPHVPGVEVRPGFPGSLLTNTVAREIDLPPPSADRKSTGRRTVLARWIASPDNPLTARVIVNRVWHHHFGRGIVATPNDFGRNGQPPTHPELLDWLATVFVSNRTEMGTSKRVAEDASGCAWRLKALHELIVCSNTYRQSSVYDFKKVKIDPDNLLLWRMNRRRLDAEALRDAILQSSGTLNLQMSGPPIRVPIEPEVYDTIFTEGEPDNLWPITPDVSQHTRRTLYLLRKRNVRLPMLVSFDSPDMMTSCGARGQTIHALQALTMMNSEFMQQQGQALAARLLKEGPSDESQRIMRLHLVTLGRPPHPEELRATEQFLRDQTILLRGRLARGETVHGVTGLPGNIDPASAAAWKDLCLVTFNLNEFVYMK